ncbi:hypothetical protein [Hafnia alvei]|uniref:hypothetical protein n=1 Tax=Hafnia alvei TaxID=569 RepID=UPI001D0F53E1|nr:hypothetical protein [Hafnia alvei]
MKKLFCGLIATVNLIIPLQSEAGVLSRATGDESRVKINFSGTVVVNGACTFTAGSTSNVEYGNVRFSTDGGSIEGNYKKSLSSVSCSGDIAGNPQLVLKSSDGTSVDFSGGKLLPVNIDSRASSALAIRLLVNGTAQDVNAWFSLNTAAIPTLEAELVQVGSGASFSSGATINSTATLTMAFN